MRKSGYNSLRNRYYKIIFLGLAILLLLFSQYLRFNVHELIRKPLADQTHFAIKELSYDMDYVRPEQMQELAGRLNQYWLKRNAQIFVVENTILKEKEGQTLIPTRDFISTNQANLQISTSESRIWAKKMLAHKNFEVFWKDAQFYTLATRIKQTQHEYWLVQRFPLANFSQEHKLYWTIFASVTLLMLAIATITYRAVERYITQPIQEIDLGLHQVLEGDFSFDYNNHYYPAIDLLGQTVTSLKNNLANQQVELSSSEQRLSLLLDHVILGVLVVDQTGHIQVYNPAASTLLGLEKSALGRSYQSVIKSFVLANMIQQVLENRTALRDEVELFIPKSLFLDVNIVPYQEANQDEPLTMVLLYDITQIKRLETVRTEFVSNASHELRTPVTAIKGFAETLLEGAIADPVLANKFVSIIAHESNRLERIIADILELSRIEKQTVSAPVVAEFDLVAVAHAMAQYFDKKAHKKAITIHVHANQDKILMQADQHRIEQILTNLIDNALNYSDVEGRIDLYVNHLDSEIELIVQDTGMGIPEEDQARIFERFYRVDKGRSRNSGGTGLGLSIVNNLVKVLNGHIEVESQVGKGSKFKLYFPSED
ncbi:two-component system histidine kinase PnpS [Vaginisenegalia massiliensis]|uniref:two-component system histidine kinase PnpS n=1 Tax=Vaginisenegalia massiliensis TaxID=2058294 RepID=UPI000F52FFEC|nr:ATP-binding protein [Vaginisenegalia massiliensis]